MKKISILACVAVLIMLLPFLNCSCSDDLFNGGQEPIEEGLPATINLKVDVSDMPEMTRAAIVDDPQSNNCENLWIGIYSKSDGSCILNKTITNVQAYLEVVGEKYTINVSGIQVTSGEAYIVAAANVNSCYAIPSPTSSISEEKLLGTLLEKADSWDKYKQICAVRGGGSDISQLGYTLVMSGSYSDDSDSQSSTTESNSEQYCIENIQTVAVAPGDNSLSGSIKLRRLLSYNKFNIKAGPNVTLKMVSWQVVNNPYYSYITEMHNNAGDDSFTDGKTTAYNPSVESNTFETGDDGGNEFEFYQFENKHTACTYSGGTDYVGIRDSGTESQMYSDREREYKDGNGANTGHYKSLMSSESDLESLKNNYASYVVLTAEVSYYVARPSDSSIESDDGDSSLKNAEPQAYDASANQIYRTAEVQYVIHLGYCEDKSDGTPTRATAMDFNCRRNTKYTYNVTVNGVKNIVVEAHQEGEDQPGAEGSVYDAFGEYVRLDAHYNTFNIALTNAERRTLKYKIIAPYAGTYNSISSDDLDTADKIAAAKKNQFYKWITFRPTTGENVLAKYPGEGSDKLWTLNELHDVDNHPHSENLESDGTDGSTTTTTTIRSTRADEDDDPEQWYTVFVDEYVYHDGETFNSSTNSYVESTWDKYVNQDDRKVELIVRARYSEDNDSEYLLCKYAFAQRSIQSYFKKVDTEFSATRADHDTEDAFGLEHTNETFCLNMRWNESNTDISSQNGRYNLWSACTAVNHKWANVIQETVPGHVDAGTCTGSNWSHEAADYPVPQLKAAYSSSTHNELDPIPDDNNFYYVNTACMNRNRDINGDGIIDNSEMKWYNPTYEEYVQIMIGLSGLVSPIIDWNKYPLDKYYTKRYYKTADGEKAYSDDKEFLHFACSDRQTIWAEEGFSNGSLYTSNGLFPYEIRCARHLGAEPGAEPTTASEVTVAYHRRSEDPSSDDYYIIDSPYYTDVCIRPFTASFIGPNAINSSANRVYRHFRVSKDYAKGLGQVDSNLKVPDSGILYMESNPWSGGYQKRSNAWYNSLKENSVCKNYSEEEGAADLGTWRVPNMKEFSMIHLLKYTSNAARVISSTYEYFYNPEFTNLTDYECRKAFFGQLSSTQISRSILRGTHGPSLDTYVRCVKDVK